MSNIFFNRFYNADAMPKWNFDVAFIFHDVAADTLESAEQQVASNAMYSEVLSRAVTNIKMPELSVEMLATYLPGLHFSFPAKPTLNGELQIRCADDSKLTIRRIADYLLQYNYNPRYQQQDYFDSGTTNYVSPAHTVLLNIGKDIVISPKFDVYVRLSNGTGDYILRVIYKNCFVKSVGSVELDYSSSELVETTFTVSYPYFKVLKPSDDEADFDKLIGQSTANRTSSIGDDVRDFVEQFNRKVEIEEDTIVIEDEVQVPNEEPVEEDNQPSEDEQIENHPANTTAEERANTEPVFDRNEWKSVLPQMPTSQADATAVKKPFPY